MCGSHAIRAKRERPEEGEGKRAEFIVDSELRLVWPVRERASERAREEVDGNMGEEKGAQIGRAREREEHFAGRARRSIWVAIHCHVG